MMFGASTSTDRSQRGRRHLVFIQYGDYRWAVVHFANGGEETYAAQRYSVDYVADLAKRMQVSVVCLAAEPHDEVLSNGVHAIGLGGQGRSQDRELFAVLRRLKPTDIVVATPLMSALLWGLLPGVRVLPFFADSFGAGGPRTRLKYKALASLLSLPQFPVVANHNRPASRDLTRIGVSPQKVVPWDWPAQHTPAEFAPKTGPAGGEITLFFAGIVCEAKGVGDLLRAVAELNKGGLPARVSIAGSGDVDEMKALAQQLGIAERANFLGKIPNRQVLRSMREHDLVVVASRPDCAEGLPMTIYEALCSRSPLLISNHPMFKAALGGQAGVQMFRAGDASDLARVIRATLETPGSYAGTSAASQDAWASIQVPLTSGKVIDLWLDGTKDAIRVLKDHAIGARESAVGSA